jgi:uncharacterized membrane protein YiaA
MGKNKGTEENILSSEKDLQVKLFELEREVADLQQLKGRFLMRNKGKTPIIDISLAIICFWWATVLFHDNRMFNNLPQLYTFFGEVSQEYHWGVLFIIVGLCLVVGVWKNVSLLMKTGLFLSVVLFAAISAGFLMSEKPMNTGSITYAAIALQALWRLREVGGIRDR